MNTLVLHGAGLHDDAYCHEIDGEVISWNISRLIKACDVGEFGRTFTFPMAVMGEPDYANLDRKKIEKFKQLPAVLARPAIAIEIKDRYRVIADGNHRITARQEMGRKDFACYIVPSWEEEKYRITSTIVEVI